MSRQRSAKKMSSPTQPSKAGQATDNQDVICAIMREGYGGDAAGVVAFAALDAWFDGEDEEFKELAALFSRLQN